VCFKACPVSFRAAFNLLTLFKYHIMKTNSCIRFIENTLKVAVIAAVGDQQLLKSTSASVTGKHHLVNADEPLKFAQVSLGFDYKVLILISK